MLPAALVAVDDSFSVPANRPLAADVSSNDRGLQLDASYDFAIQGIITYRTAQGASGQVPASAGSNAFRFTPDGQLTFNPLAMLLRSGTVVTFAYALQPKDLPGMRSNTALVTITVTDPLAAPPSPPLPAGKARLSRESAEICMHGLACCCCM